MFYLAVIIVLASFILGGSTSHGFLSDALLQLIAVPIVIISLWQASTKPSTSQAKMAVFFCLIMVLLPLLQLIPLPSEIWTTLPGRENASAALKLAFDPLPSMPLSLAPRETWLSFLAMLPPLAVFMIVYQLNDQERQRLISFIVIFGIISVFLGLLQLIQGPFSPLRFFEITNRGDSVGFFANRNHYAASLYSFIVLAAAMILMKLGKARQQIGYQEQDITKMLSLLISFTIITIFIVGQLMARSRSGLGLTILALGGIYLLYRTTKSRRQKSKTKAAKLMMTAIILIMLFASQFALFRMMDRFGNGVSEQNRLTFAQLTIKASKDAMPFGTGLGSFVPVFRQYETANPKMRGDVYANHAHNDYLEFWLETGVVGLAIMIIFGFWYLIQVYKVWWLKPDKGQKYNLLPAKAATIIIALLLLHSLVSYPLRTAAIMGMFAFSCALLVKPASALK